VKSPEETVQALAVLLPDVVDDACQLMVCEDGSWDSTSLGKLERIAREAERCKTMAVVVSNGVEAVAAVETMASVTAAIKELEEMRTKFCDPLRKIWMDSRAIFEAPLAALEAIAGKDGSLRRALNAYNVAENARRLAEERRIAREAEEAALAEAKAREEIELAATAEERKRASEAVAAAVEVQRKAIVEAPRELKGVKSASGTYSGRKVWVVLGIHSLRKVPRQYLRSDRMKEALMDELRAAVRSGVHAIPGVTIEEQTEGTFRGRR
jgi:hypothetical protein